MGMTMRKDVPEELTWDLTLIYRSEEDAKADIEKMQALAAETEKKYKGKRKRVQA